MKGEYHSTSRGRLGLLLEAARKDGAAEARVRIEALEAALWELAAKVEDYHCKGPDDRSVAEWEQAGDKLMAALAVARAALRGQGAEGAVSTDEEGE